MRGKEGGYVLQNSTPDITRFSPLGYNGSATIKSTPERHRGSTSRLTFCEPSSDDNHRYPAAPNGWSVNRVCPTSIDRQCKPIDQGHNKAPEGMSGLLQHPAPWTFLCSQRVRCPIASTRPNHYIFLFSRITVISTVPLPSASVLQTPHDTKFTRNTCSSTTNTRHRCYLNCAHHLHN